MNTLKIVNFNFLRIAVYLLYLLIHQILAAMSKVIFLVE